MDKSPKTRPRATVVQNVSSLFQKSGLNWRQKVEKTIKAFKYDLSQIPYDYTVKVTNRFNALDIVW